MIVLFWSRTTGDLLKSLGWRIAALHRLRAVTKLPSPQRLGDYLRWGSSLTPASPWPSTISDAAIHWREGSKV
jgi:hypothetical protein